MSDSDATQLDSSFKVYFSTVVRSSPLLKGGEIVLLDWESKTIEAKQPIFPKNPEIIDPNPRGNGRGGRGIEFFGNDVVVADYHTLEIYDYKLNQRMMLRGLNQLLCLVSFLCRCREYNV